MHFGKEFKKLVEGRAETFEEIAQALGFKSKSSLSYYFKCEKRPKTDILDRICGFFGVSPDYFNDNENGGKLVFRQSENNYVTQINTIPVFTDESEDALKIGEITMGSLGINDGFAIVADERLEKLGIPIGSTLFMTSEGDMTSAEIIIVETESERFFACCEKRGDSVFIYPLDPDKEPIKLGGNIKIFAVLKQLLVKPSALNLRH